MPYFEVQLTKKLHRTYDVHPDSVIGRAPQCEIQLLSRAVSRRHARVELGHQGEVIVSDLGTKNGIKLNGQKVVGAAVINEGDMIVVGDVTMTFRAGTSGTPESMAGIDLRGRDVTNEDVMAAQEAEVAFRIPAEAEAVARFCATIGRARIETLEFDDVTQLKLQVALKESLENARIHGSGGDPSKSIHVAFFDSPEEFRFSVRDEGHGFDVNGFLARAEEVDALAAVRDRPSLGAGLGLKMILNCVDRLQFESGGATIHMARFKAEGEMFVISEEDTATNMVSPLDETTEEADPAQQSWVDMGAAPAGDAWWDEPIEPEGPDAGEGGMHESDDELTLGDLGSFGQPE